MSAVIRAGSWSRTSTAAVFDPDVPAETLRVLAALGSYADESGYCYPAMATIAARLGRSRRIVFTHIKRLANLGYIVIERRFRIRGGGKAPHGYRLVFPLPPAPQPRDQVRDGAIDEGATPHADPTVKPASDVPMRNAGDVKPGFTSLPDKPPVKAISGPGDVKFGDNRCEVSRHPRCEAGLHINYPSTTNPKGSSPKATHAEKKPEDQHDEIMNRLVAIGMRREDAWTFMIELDDQGELTNIAERQRNHTLSDDQLRVRLEASSRTGRGQLPASKTAHIAYEP